MAKETTHKDDTLWQMVLNGRLLSIDMFKRNWLSIFAIMMMFIIYITNRYDCITKMETIQALELELEVMQTERLLQQSQYMSQTRETAMHHLVDTMKLGLSHQQRPPYKLSIHK